MSYYELKLRNQTVGSYGCPCGFEMLNSTCMTCEAPQYAPSNPTLVCALALNHIQTLETSFTHLTTIQATNLRSGRVGEVRGSVPDLGPTRRGMKWSSSRLPNVITIVPAPKSENLLETLILATTSSKHRPCNPPRSHSVNLCHRRE